MKHHPFAKLFPMQSDEEIQSLADDIAKHGLRQPIVIDENEEILDGRNRAAACAIAQVQPVYEPFVGSDAQKLAYVASVNIHRRHLTNAQRAEIAAKIATMKTGENQHTGKKKKEGGSNELPSKPVTTEQAAKLMNVSVASVKRAKAKASPEKPGAAKPANPPKAASATVTTTKSSRPPRHLGEHRESETFALGTADVAIAQLKGIPMENKFRDAAIDRVLSWIGSQRTQKRKKPTTSVNQ
jgi:ParB-like chromosome segregation protein Spo0J